MIKRKINGFILIHITSNILMHGVTDIAKRYSFNIYSIDMNSYKNVVYKKYILSDISGLKYFYERPLDKKINIEVVLLLIDKD